ncbi:LLM class flavin-dependent oxidoreductase [Modestobacter sp. VKM Ac-2979]|uniref:LLM class flavin-dependent oxidoreductase n=1 Tax=unclassified Modestobacter TaxID=2643866 RepID=UPI0022ABBD68|nr:MULTISPECIES: LLM class flavin-dependent oxidoreductase [unclassified Modestobacter]MCZ2810510.1 LLM class flavin-dependent oxidoreductase [Modestobacter sp. VKM Ac-2979]MCZ2841996.1 LLM class flavin-dependent oxidoreductase [Modestobacter sp. VKM Ac-2980]
MSETPLPLSVLELATVGSGQTTADALAHTVAVAQAADRLGYRRLWVAEHHNMPAVASTNPPVLIAHLAAVTDRIAVGSGGVMLPNHAPLVVAEQFALLEALHPGRIDLGIGRAPGTDQHTALALRRDPKLLSAEQFPQDLLDLLGLFGDQRVEGGLAERFTATPAAVSAPRVVLLGSSSYSAQLAGQLGLPFTFAHHFGSPHAVAALELYRESFRPSDALPRPYAVVTASTLVADSDEEARRLALPGQLMRLSIRTNRLRPVPSLAEAATDPERAAAEGMPSNAVVGGPERAVTELRQLAADTGADELMVTASTHGVAERVRSLELLAAAWGLTPAGQATAA